MQMSLIRSTFVCLLAIGAITSAISAHADQAVQTDQGVRATLIAPQKERLFLAAGGNPAVCKANYERCVNACDGMSGCINQCAANYRGCLGL